MRKGYDIRRLWLRKIIKAYSFVFTVSLGLYILFAFFDPGLLSYDLRQKFRALADETITVTATVLGPPVQPVVSAVAQCDESAGKLSVTLDWSDDPNTYTYDVDRDTTPLVSGLSASAYQDTNVAVNTTYEYEVTANGPMGPGSATSDPVSVTMPAECEVTAAAPAVTIVSFAGKNIDSYKGAPRTSTRRPLFTGTTSMPNADMTVVVGDIFLAQFEANTNGYWEWRPPYDISSGKYTLTVTATDPDDTLRQATATLNFEILKRSDGRDSSSDTKNDQGQSDTSENVGAVTASETREEGTINSSSKPVIFALSLQKSDVSLFQDKEVKILVNVKSLLERYAHITIPVRYSLTDKDYNIIFSELRSAYITSDATIEESFTIPEYIQPGQYFMQVEMLLDHLSVSRMIPFSVTALPLIELPSGKVITYPDVVHHLGWLVFFFLFTFLFWMAFFIREFAFMLRSGKTVTEYDLKKAGFIRK
jgi:hypothetical protein